MPVIPLFLLLVFVASCGSTHVYVRATPEHLGSEEQGPSQRAEHFARECDQGNLESCVTLGHFYLNGLEGLPRDDQRAYQLFYAGCAGGVILGCANLGFVYEHGRGTGQDYEIARELYRDACGRGNQWSCTSLGVLLRHGRGGPQDLGMARGLFEQGCQMEDGRACSNLGAMYRNAIGVEGNDELAAAYFEQGCGFGHAWGCTSLGWLYERGRGVEEDKEQAVYYYQKGCDGQDALGCTNLGWMVENGVGVSANPTLAARFYEKGCAGGEMRGCSNLGVLYRRGQGVEEDFERAQWLYKQACDGGHGRGCVNLGALFQDGTALEPDPNRAMEYFSMACELDYEAGCRLMIPFSEHPEWRSYLKRSCELNAASCLRNASALSTREQSGDIEKALELLEMGCEAGNFSSCSARAGVRHERFLPQYRANCQEGKGLDCLRLAVVGDQGAFSGYGGYCRESSRELADAEAIDNRCEEGDLEACWLRGSRLLLDDSKEQGLAMVGAGGLGMLLGSLVQGSREEIRAELSQGCEEGDLKACTDLGLHLRRYEEEAEKELSWTYLERGCTSEEPRGCRELGRLLLNDESKRERGASLLREACEGDYVAACVDLGRHILASDEDPDHTDVVTLLDRACTDGATSGCWPLQNYFQNRSEGLHDQACYYHYALEGCSLDVWTGCGVFSGN